MSDTINIHLGFFAPTIAAQLREQGFRYDPDKAKLFQKYSTYIGELALGDIINDVQKKKMLDRLFTQIKRHVVQMNRPKKRKAAKA